MTQGSTIMAIPEIRYTKALTTKLTNRAKHQCECKGCSHHRGRCPLKEGATIPGLSIEVALSIIPTDRNPANKSVTNLRLVCQECKEHHEEVGADQPSLFTLDTLRKGA